MKGDDVPFSPDGSWQLEDIQGGWDLAVMQGLMRDSAGEENKVLKYDAAVETVKEGDTRLLPRKRSKNKLGEWRRVR